VLAEPPVSMLFGPNGPSIIDVIERARRLNHYDSDRWNTWLAPLAPDSYHLGNDHPNTLAIFTDHELGKTEPIGAEFLVWSRVVSKR
jgi:hypothetical protein